jgi:uncharacterized protein DUF397
VIHRPPAVAHARWRKSSHSDGGSGCIELAAPDEWIAVRDSKDPRGSSLLFPAPSFHSFLAATKVR